MSSLVDDPHPGPAAPEADDDVARNRPGRRDPRDARDDRRLVALVALVGLPLVWMGYGTDIDIGNVLHTGELIRAGDYLPSRRPGLPVFEAIVTVLNPLGGHVLVNLATLAAAAVTAVGVARLVRAWGHADGHVIALAFLACPVTIIAATSTTDFVWALAFFVLGANLHLRDRPVAAGLLFGLAVGSRLSSALVVGAFLVADGWDRAHRRRCLGSAAVAGPLGALLYVPAWLVYDRSLDMFDSADGYRGFANNLGRFAYKNYGAAGPALVAVVLLATPALVAAARRWRDDPMVRFGVLGLLATEGLYFVMPWKLGHLLPGLLALLLWLGASCRPAHLRVLVVAVAVNGLVCLRLLTPDDPGNASGGAWSPEVRAGLLVNDVRCRLAYMDRRPQDDGTEAWACTLAPLSGDVADPG